MGYNLFQRRGPADAEATEFAATVASMPPEAEAVAPASLPPAPVATGTASDLLQRAGPDSGLLDSQPSTLDPTIEYSPTLSHIGRYAIKGPLGQGGLGQVHEAWDPLLSRTVAVKTLQFDVGMTERVSLDDLFLNEARAAAGLSHPHIVTIHDAGLSRRWASRSRQAASAASTARSRPLRRPAPFTLRQALSGSGRMRAAGP